jgi:hypothetical protein
MRHDALRAILAIGALTGLAACGTAAAQSPPAPGPAASIPVKLKVVPTVRSVTISPAKAKFGDCQGGWASRNTASTPAALGYPNGYCWLGKPMTSFPVTITNSGIAADIYVSGSDAVPADGGAQWSLCNLGAHPAVACTSRGGLSPGKDQYVVQNFAPNRGLNSTGLTNTPTCDVNFGPGDSCWTTSGQSQREGFELTGPAVIDDSSTSWTVTIIWTPVPK